MNLHLWKYRLRFAWRGIRFYLTKPFDIVARALIARVSARAPDFVVGGEDDPYLRRWFVIPRNRFFNIYLHQFLRDDDDRALHDHPWFWCSILLVGSYIEHTIAAGGIHRRQIREAPSIKISGPWRAHRIELLSNTPNPANAFETWPRKPAWTLFITGPHIRAWGFHCPQRGWVHYRDFTDPTDTGKAGKGCDA